jgi:hypothetical protein
MEIGRDNDTPPAQRSPLIVLERVDGLIKPWVSFTELVTFFDESFLGKLVEDPFLGFQIFGLRVVHDRRAVDAHMNADGFPAGNLTCNRRCANQMIDESLLILWFHSEQIDLGNYAGVRFDRRHSFISFDFGHGRVADDRFIEKESAQDRSANTPLLVAGSHGLCVRTEPSLRKVAGLTFTDQPFLDCDHIATQAGPVQIRRTSDLRKTYQRRHLDLDPLLQSRIFGNFLARPGPWTEFDRNAVAAHILEECCRRTHPGTSRVGHQGLSGQTPPESLQ